MIWLTSKKSFLSKSNNCVNVSAARVSAIMFPIVTALTCCVTALTITHFEFKTVSTVANIKD